MAPYLAHCLARLFSAPSPHSSRALQLRFGAAAILAFVFAGTGLLLATVLRNGSEVGSLLSASATASGNPLSLYSAGEFIAGFTLAAAFCGSLHLLSQRGAVGRIGELLFIACAVVFTLTAHRNGMIDRPFLLGDFALIRGYDPRLFSNGDRRCLSAIADCDQPAGVKQRSSALSSLGPDCCEPVADALR